MIQVNNDYTFDFDVVNYAPEILTLTSSTRSALVGDTVTVTATAFDVEGDKVEYAFTDGNGADMVCADIGLALTGECTFTVDITMVPMLEVRVVASDPFDSDDETIAIDVAVAETFTASGLADGFAAVYSITAKTSGLSVSFADGSLDPVTNPSLSLIHI